VPTRCSLPSHGAAAPGDCTGTPWPNTLTFHFDKLRHAGLVACRRDGRSLIYSARYETMNALLAYLTENCCAGDRDACEACDCQPASKRKRGKVPA
jgi:ArsR family transcriptional regulator